MAKQKNVSSTFNAEQMLLSKNSPFSVQEAYKTLRTNISFSLPGGGCKCIGIVSPNRGDGKSSIAVNLAISCGQINKRVLLVDCDMRLPTIASKLGIKSQPGLSNYLVESDGTDDIPVIKIEEKGIDVIPSGNIPPDPTTLLESRQMVNLVEKLRQEYDFIIFDFPPIAVVSDAVILSKCVDGYLIVVRHDASEFAKVEETLRQMRFADAKIIGFVYNGKSSGKKYYKKSKYSYGYYKNSSKNG